MRFLGLSLKACDYKVRSFEDGDEVEFVRLFNRMYADYGGFALRTPEYWRWCCLERPDVEREGLFVVVDGDESVVGYAVVGGSGNVWELCYDSERDGEGIVSLLLDKAVCYLERVGATSVTFNVLKEDQVLNRVRGKFGFAVLPPPQMFLSVLNFRKFFSVLLNSKKEELMTEFDEAVVVKLTDAPFWVDATFFIQINQDGVTVGSKSESPTVQVETDVITLSSLLFGKSSPFQSLIRLKLRVSPFWKIPTLLRLLSSLQVRAAWFFPLSDYG